MFEKIKESWLYWLPLLAIASLIHLLPTTAAVMGVISWGAAEFAAVTKRFAVFLWVGPDSFADATHAIFIIGALFFTVAAFLEPWGIRLV